MTEKQLLILIDIILVVIITMVFFQSIYQVVDDSHHKLLITAKDAPIFHDAAIASPHNIVYANLTIPKNTRLLISNFDLPITSKGKQSKYLGAKMGLVEIKYTDDWALAYPYIVNKKLADKVIDLINQPTEEKEGRYTISVHNE